MGKDYDEFLSWYKKENSPTKRFFKGLKPIHYALLIILLAVGYWLFQQEDINKNIVIGVLAVIIIIVIIFGFKKAEKNEPIPEHIIKKIVELRMKKKIGNELPTGTTILSALYCRMRFEGTPTEKMTPFQWAVGIRIVYPESWLIPNLIRDVVVVCNPWKGYITAIEPRPTGYDPREAGDIKFVPVNIVMGAPQPSKSA